ncbi:MAG TPA: MFS transporter [Xanthobacteraceae bacterium]|jgi:MFS family permease|nr:MFS transporter [Xanthobacteraceae bacterium]
MTTTAKKPEAREPAAVVETWRTPAVIVLCGCLIGLLTFGPRSAAGQFLTPLSFANGWGRDVFSMAFAIQNLLWGVGQPFAGAIADRFGTVRVLCTGAIMYGLGLAIMAYASNPLALDFSAGVLIGFGLAGCSFNLVLSAFGKLVPEAWRSLALGAGTAAGSFGQFLFSPLARVLIDAFGWQPALLTFAAGMLLVLPLSLALATPRSTPASGKAAPQSLKQALAEAFGHRSYVLLVLGFFTCGFQLAFITVHLPAYLVDRGLSAEVGGWTIAVIGLFNIVGSLSAGWLSTRMPKRFLLSGIYFVRAAAVLAFIVFPVSTASSIAFGAMMGLLWLSTVPPTASLVAVMFGNRWGGMLYGFAFFSHQVGGFLGVLLGGLAFERTGSYDAVWWLSILFGVLSALINLPIVEKPVRRLAIAAA